MGKKDFLSYLSTLTKKKNLSTWDITLKHLKEFSKGRKIIFNEIDSKWCESFKDYLLTKVSINSTKLYFSKLKAALNKAVLEGEIAENPANKVKIKSEEKQREFLNEEEIQQLINTPFRNINLKNAFLFSCFTGLRLSDIRALTYDKLKGGYIYFKQKKTTGVERFKLSKNALKIIELQKKENKGIKQVFKLSTSTAMIELHLKKWTEKAEIKKKVTFHVGRHSFAVIALLHDMDIYTLSKLLGHKDLTTTQIYAKIIDKKKDEAIDKLPEFDLE
jgi:integrase